MSLADCAGHQPVSESHSRIAVRGQGNSRNKCAGHSTLCGSSWLRLDQRQPPPPSNHACRGHHALEQPLTRCSPLQGVADTGDQRSRWATEGGEHAEQEAAITRALDLTPSIVQQAPQQAGDGHWAQPWKCFRQALLRHVLAAGPGNELGSADRTQQVGEAPSSAQASAAIAIIRDNANVR